MGMFTNPLSHAGYPPGVTGRPETQPTEVRAATPAEAIAGVLDSVYISPATFTGSGSDLGPRTLHGVILGEGITNPLGATVAGSAGQLLTSGGASADPLWTTATYPASSGGTGKILYDNGTNFVESVPTFPAAASASSGKIITSDGTNWIASTNTFPNTATQGALIAATGANAIGQIIDVAVGQVLASGGVGVVPAYTATPSVTSVTTTNGFTATVAGAGITLNSAATSGTTTATLNGRSGQITITTPTINAGSTFTMTIANTSITGSSTQVLYGLTGGTTGSAITIQSVTNSANQSAVVVQNASAVTNSTGSLVLTFLVLN
jgi:hypothetical protein